MTTPETPVQETAPIVNEKQSLNKRFEAVGWGLFLIMIGGISFIPDNMVPEGLWSIGVGLILLGLNAARYYNGIRMSGFTTFLGIIALFTGLVELIGLDLPTFPILLILLGAYLIIKPWFDQRQLFGKAEQSE